MYATLMPFPPHIEATDAERMHKFICSFFPKGLRPQSLWRPFKGQLLVFSELEPDAGHLGFQAMRELYSGRLRSLVAPVQDILNRETLSFRVTLNPITQYSDATNPKKTHERLVPEERVDEWFLALMERNGFEVVQYESARSVMHAFKGQKARAYEFLGRVKVSDKAKAEVAYTRGIGRKKTFGFGLLLLG